MEAGYTQQSAADHLLSCPFAVFCRYGGNIYLTHAGGKEYTDTVHDCNGGIHGLPPSLTEIYGSDIKKVYKANGVPLYLGLFTISLSAFLHLMLMCLIIYIAAPIAFDAQLPERPLWYFIRLSIFIGVSLSLGSILGLSVKNQSKLTMVSQIAFLPSIMLSGIMFPAGLLPRPLAVIGRIFPAAWGFRLLTGDGSVCSSLFPLAVIFAVCAAICVLALRRVQTE